MNVNINDRVNLARELMLPEFDGDKEELIPQWTPGQIVGFFELNKQKIFIVKFENYFVTEVFDDEIIAAWEA